MLVTSPEKHGTVRKNRNFWPSKPAVPQIDFNIYGNDLVGKLQASNSQRYYYLKDHLGSIRVTLDQSGNVDSWTDYYPFGKESQGSSSASEPKEGFSGKQFDGEIGLNYFGARYYNPVIARFITMDRFSVKLPHFTPYQYAADNPMRYIDHNGDSIVVSGDVQGMTDMMREATTRARPYSNDADLISIDGQGNLLIDKDNYEGGNEILDALIEMNDNKGKILFRGFKATSDNQVKPTNNSITPRDGVGKPDKLPAGYIGEVAMPVNGKFTEYFRDFKTGNPRAWSVPVTIGRAMGHEILEQKGRTLEGKRYDQAHKDANRSVLFDGADYDRAYPLNKSSHIEGKIK